MNRDALHVPSDQWSDLKKRPMTYFFVSHDGEHCKIGFSQDTANRVRGQLNGGTWKFYAAIVSSAGDDLQFQRHFDTLRYDNKPEIYWLKDELKEYLEWLGTRAFAATSLDELHEAYPHPVRFPWQAWRDDRADMVDTLQLFAFGGEHIVPGLRQPLSRGERILVTIRSESDDWYTPPAYTAAAREVMGGIDLDPASSPLANMMSVHATSIYTRMDDGLRYQWRGRVWMNPPYGNEKDAFVNHLLAEYHAGHVTEAVMCLNAHAVDTVWFQPLWQYPCCFTHHRVLFFDGRMKKPVEETAPTTGTVFVYVGPKRERFIEVFSRFGPVVTGVTPASIPSEEFRRRQRAEFGWTS